MIFAHFALVLIVSPFFHSTLCFARQKAEKERRKAEVRARLEAQARKKKKGFMTPERKKRLRVCSTNKANVFSRNLCDTLF